MMNFRSAKRAGCALFAGASLMGCAVDAGPAAGGEPVGETSQALDGNVYGRLEIGGRCLDLRSGVEGGIVQIFNCNNGSNQNWQFLQGYWIRSGAKPAWYTLTYQPQYGDFVTASGYDLFPDETFVMPTTTITSKLGLCLGNGAPDNIADLEACGTPNTTNWTFDETTSTIRDPLGRCLTSSRQNQYPAFFEACYPSYQASAQNQVWALGASGSIRQNGFCLDVRAGQNKAGTVVQVFNCTGASNQSWSFTGQLTMPDLSGECMYVPSLANQTQIALGSCAEPNSTWTYRW